MNLISPTILCCLGLALGADDIRFDLAAGPSFQSFPGPISDINPWVTGITLDAAADVPASVAKEKAPERWKNKIPSSGQVEVRPWWLLFLPRTVIASPGSPLSMFGATWDLFGVSEQLDFGSSVRLKAEIRAPEIWWLQATGTATSSPSLFAGIAAAPTGSFEVDPTPWLRLSTGWTHHLGVPLGSIHLKQGAESPWEWGSAWFMVHIRPTATF
jgi:hypothetical protein